MNIDEYWREKVSAYVMQGDYVALHMEEQRCNVEELFVGYPSEGSQVYVFQSWQRCQFCCK